MGLLEFNKDPSRRELITFGAIFALFFAFIGALLRWKFAAPGVATVVWSVAGALTAIYFLLPPLRRPLYLGWCGLTWPIGWVVSHTVLAVVYYVVFTLTGLALRVTGRDPMQRRFDPQARTYWTRTRQAKNGDRAGYFRQF